MKGKITFYCDILAVTRQGFYSHLENPNKPYKYAILAALMKEIIDECNDSYGARRMREALL